MPFQIQKAAYALLIFVLIFTILIYAKGFLVPVSFAAILGMLLLPLARWMEAKGIHHAIATAGSVLVILVILTALIFFIQWQLSNIIDDADQIEKEIVSRYHDLRNYIAANLGISIKQQNRFIQQQSGSAGKGAGAYIATTLGGFGSFLANFILVLVYTFLFIFYRRHLKKFFLSMVSERHKQNTEIVIDNSQKVAQKYLGGMSLMIVGLWIMYGIGFSIVGVNNALFFAILCGLLEIVPFVGNLVGTSLTILMALAQGGGPGMILGIVITYGIVQFVQTYLLEPLVVGQAFVSIPYLPSSHW
jgi:predicted PurR-regulated permease PerM